MNKKYIYIKSKSIMMKLFSKVSALVKKASQNYFFWLVCAAALMLVAIAIWG